MCLKIWLGTLCLQMLLFGCQMLSIQKEKKKKKKEKYTYLFLFVNILLKWQYTKENANLLTTF